MIAFDTLEVLTIFQLVYAGPPIRAIFCPNPSLVESHVTASFTSSCWLDQMVPTLVNETLHLPHLAELRESFRNQRTSNQFQ